MTLKFLFRLLTKINNQSNIFMTWKQIYVMLGLPFCCCRTTSTSSYGRFGFFSPAREILFVNRSTSVPRGSNQFRSIWWKVDVFMTTCPSFSNFICLHKHHISHKSRARWWSRSDVPPESSGLEQHKKQPLLLLKHNIPNHVIMWFPSKSSCSL